MILTEASDTGAQIALERLRATIEAHSFPQVGRVTVSLGFTRIDKADTPSNSVERADAALYYAKAHGRNNLQNFEALVAAGELTVKRASDNVELPLATLRARALRGGCSRNIRGQLLPI